MIANQGSDVKRGTGKILFSRSASIRDQGAIEKLPKDVKTGSIDSGPLAWVKYSEIEIRLFKKIKQWLWWHPGGKVNREQLKKEAAIELWNEWARRNPKSYRARLYKRMALLASARGTYSEKQWQEKLEYHDHRCVYCGVSGSEKKLTKDHKIPISKGGTNWISNIAPCCQKCNSKKHDMTSTEFVAKMRATYRRSG